MKLLMYSHDTYGLGNIRRMLAIAEYLSGKDEELSILLLSGSPMLHAFRIPRQVDYVKLPCLSRTESGEYVSPYLDIDFNEVIRMRSNLILSTVLDYQPDILLVDKKPLGLAGELSPALEMLNRRGQRPRQVLLLRDILDSPDVTRGIWEKNGYYGVIESWYDAVLVAGEKKIFDVVEEYGFPPGVAGKTEYCGYLERPTGNCNGQAVRARHGISDAPLVLVTAGGGADGCRLLTGYLQGLHDAGCNTGFQSLVLTGPELSNPECRSVMELATTCRDVYIEEFTDDMMSYMDAADVVVSMGGYNTVCELLSIGKQAIIVPRTVPVMEQCIRAERLAALGLVQAIHPDRMTPSVLMCAVRRAIERRSDSHDDMPSIRMDGMENIRKQLFAPAGRSDTTPGYRPVGLPHMSAAVAGG